MARVSKVCHSASCAGTKQPVQVEFVPASETDPSPGGHSYRATCKTCGEEHPPDAAFDVQDAKDWKQKVRAANAGAFPTEPLQEP